MLSARVLCRTAVSAVKRGQQQRSALPAKFPIQQEHRFSSSSARTTRVGLSPRNSNSNSNNSIPPYIWLFGGIPVAGGAFLYYRFLDTAPLTERRRWIATSAQWERDLGDQEYQSLKKQFRGKVLPKDHTATITVERVGRRICQSADLFAKEYALDYNTRNTTFTVVRSDTANAFVLPNNHVFVMTGLFQFARDEDELAAVLGHEMAHCLARHVGEKVSGGAVVSILARLSLLLDPSGVLFTIFLPASNLFRELPHSRIQESEADRIGMHLAAKACYDPQAAQRVFTRMKEGTKGQQQPPEFLSTHPSHDSRIQQMGDWLPETSRFLTLDGGERCERIRQEMAMARRIAAQRHNKVVVAT
jgi:predicted Zn-dependent protease